MEKGYLRHIRRAKAGAYDTIDNVRKFALDDSDYEEFEEWIEYTPEELKEREADEARSGLAASDYVIIKAVEALLSCQSVTELLQALGSIREAHRDILSHRAQWRERLNELGASAHGENTN